jgi:hypothetical protein
MEIGLFTAAKAVPPAIPAGETLVRTSGYLTPGKGYAEYAYDSTKTASFASTDHPRCAFVDASGRVFRLVSNPINILMTGAVADGTTDCADPIKAARDYLTAINLSGGSIFVPVGKFRVGSTIAFSSLIRIFGEGNSQNPGVVNKDGVQTIYNYPDLYRGSMLYFDAGVSGLEFFPHTDEPEQATVTGNIASTHAASPYWEFQSANRAIARDLLIVSASQKVFSAGKHGIKARCVVMFENLWVIGFPDSGVRLEGTTDGAGTIAGGEAEYGNVDQSSLRNVKAIENGGDGFYLKGRDANVVELLSCDAAGNGKIGFNDLGLLGNTYLNCHANNNAQGSFKGTGPVAAHTYIGCYSEDSGDAKKLAILGPGAMVLGGMMSSATFHPTNSQALVVNGAGGHRGVLSATNDLDDNLADDLPALRVRGGVGRDPSQTAGTAMWFGSVDDSGEMDGFRLKYSRASRSWAIEYANAGLAASPIQFANGLSTWRGGSGGFVHAPSFPQGIYLGPDAAGPRIHYGTAAPASGNWKAGDMVLNSAPASGQPSYWQCTAAGSPGTWKAGPNLA